MPTSSSGSTDEHASGDRHHRSGKSSSSSSREKDGREKSHRQRSEKEPQRERRHNDPYTNNNAFETEAFADASAFGYNEEPTATAAHSGAAPKRRQRRASIAGGHSGGLGGNSGHGDKASPQVTTATNTDYAYGEQHQHQQQPETAAGRPRRTRRASLVAGGDVNAVKTGTSMRQISSTKSCDGLDDMRNARRSGLATTPTEAPPQRARRGRRASMAGSGGPPVRAESASAVEDFGYNTTNAITTGDEFVADFGDSAGGDYGYGESAPDYGYGHEAAAAPTAQFAKERTSRQSNLLANLRHGDYKEEASSKTKPKAYTGIGVDSLKIAAMAAVAPEPVARPRRRASLIGAVSAFTGGGGAGHNTHNNKDETNKRSLAKQKSHDNLNVGPLAPAQAYDPSRDRSRAGLLDRVATERNRSGTGDESGYGKKSSYSDRIMQGGR
jgi:hypothetical protein